MIILGSNKPHKVGEIWVGATDQIARLHKQPYKVMRESNYVEWVECFLSLGGNPNLINNDPSYQYFYEVITD